MESLPEVRAARVFVYPRIVRLFPFDTHLEAMPEVIRYSESEISAHCWSDLGGYLPVDVDGFGRAVIRKTIDVSEPCLREFEEWLSTWICFPGQQGDVRGTKGYWLVDEHHGPYP